MKKLYTTLALACAVALGASAAMPVAKFERNLDLEVLPVESFTLPYTPSASKAPAKKVAVAPEDLDGLYKWDYYSLWPNDEANPWESTVGAIRQVMGPMITFSGFLADFNGEIDETTGVITIEGGQILGHSAKYNSDIYLTSVMGTVGEDGKFHVDITQATTGNITATWDGEKVVFPELLVLLAQLPADHPTDAFGSFAGWTSITVSPFVDKTEWKTIGTVEMTDGWLMPAFGIDPTEYPYEAILQVDPNNSARYSILDPYKNNPLSIPFTEDGVEYCYNTDENASGRIVLDTTNPDCVFVEQGFYCGFSDEDNGRYYPSNLEGYNATAGATAEQLIPWLEANGKTPSTFKNNVAELHNLVFGITGDELAGYSWRDEAGAAVPMNSTITFKIENGVEDTFIGNENAPVEYFNLQGVRVANPENGLYIRRQGNTATKVIVK